MAVEGWGVVGGRSSLGEEDGEEREGETKPWRRGEEQDERMRKAERKKSGNENEGRGGR